jgi:MFS family permease
MLGWFAELNTKERRTMGACFGGWALDAFDVQMYSFVIPTVIALWGLSRGQAGLIGTVTLLISSLGGWFSGTLADRFGRVRMLQITILWYSVFTFLCAFAQNFEQLFVLRALHGLGFGGEWAAGAVLMGEVIRDKYRGRGVGIVQTGWAIGWGVSAVVYTALYAFLRRSPGACCSRSACCRRSLCSGSAATSTSPRSFAMRNARARPSALPICFRPFAARICGPRSRCR